MSIAQEHFATWCCADGCSGLARGWGHGVGPLALLACLPGERHDLGLLVFGLALRARGWRIAYLGADTPVEIVGETADALEPARSSCWHGPRRRALVGGRRRRAGACPPPPGDPRRCRAPRPRRTPGSQLLALAGRPGRRGRARHRRHPHPSTGDGRPSSARRSCPARRSTERTEHGRRCSAEPPPGAADAGHPCAGSDDLRREGSGHPYPPIEPLLPPKGAPNVLIVLIDDVGFGASSAFGGPCRTPNFERLAAGGLKYTRFHTTALCSPTRSALLTGRNHHSVGMGNIAELATSAPGNSSIWPNTAAPLAKILQPERVQHGPVRQVPRGAGLGDEPDGAVPPVAERHGLRLLLRVPRRRDQPVVPGAVRGHHPGRAGPGRPRRATTSTTTCRRTRSGGSASRRR